MKIAAIEIIDLANIPATQVCMQCHTQIWTDSPALEPVRESFRTGRSLHWTRVYDLPDFSYFNHSIHVAKGVGCATCHGRVDEMPLVRREKALFMEWCLSCHRDPAPHLRPREKVFDLAWEPGDAAPELGRKLARAHGVWRPTDCSVCHY